MVYTFGQFSAVSLFASALTLGEKHRIVATGKQTVHHNFVQQCNFSSCCEVTICGQVRTKTCGHWPNVGFIQRYQLVMSRTANSSRVPDSLRLSCFNKKETKEDAGLMQFLVTSQYMWQGQVQCVFLFIEHASGNTFVSVITCLLTLFNLNKLIPNTEKFLITVNGKKCSTGRNVDYLFLVHHCFYRSKLFEFHQRVQ